ncbi:MULTISPECIES: hypothetical protein [Bizionia]|uniref:Vitellogenin II n=1 Tax=Bizionia algoritergicola TaxID=291187 RepID=A0A5D0QUR7_9FLAO|nr:MULTISPECIES: hypothetical protein [Bizionia]OBX21704.1 hypothetical protein BAA08_11560 [Bizionia sp. APA-3]TYB71944.1 hypothetical protein ES675_12310 [Bizionia algoritergicola]
MSYKNYFTEKIPTIAILSSLLLVTACGTYQQVDTDNDGIYSSTSTSVEQETYAEANNANSSTYYENYFKEKSSELELYTEDEVFTDVDDYEGDYVENDSLQVERDSYAGWGQENSNVSINVYGGVGFYDSFYSPFNYGYSPFWSGYGYGYGYGYYPPYYAGWGYGGYYSPWYGGGYYNHQWNGYYYRNNVAYVNGRRGSAYNQSGRYASSRYYDSDRIYNTQTRRNASKSDVTRRSRSQSTYSTPRTTRSNNDVRTRTRTRTNTSTPQVRTNNNTRTRTNTTNTRPKSNNTISTPRRTSSPSMSTGGSRGSSGGGVRSSGSRRGGGL